MTPTSNLPHQYERAKRLNLHSHAYADFATQTPIKTTKDIEYDIIFDITRRLRTSWEKRKVFYPEFISVLKANRSLWNVLSADVSGPGNQLPAELRAQIFYLGEFVQDYSRRVMKDDADIRPLLDVNLCVLRGLSDQGMSK